LGVAIGAGCNADGLTRQEESKALSPPCFSYSDVLFVLPETMLQSTNLVLAKDWLTAWVLLYL
jgi:hypothetical protein